MARCRLPLRWGHCAASCRVTDRGLVDFSYPLRQRPQLLRQQAAQVVFVELLKAVVAEMHVRGAAAPRSRGPHRWD